MNIGQLTSPNGDDIMKKAKIDSAINVDLRNISDMPLNSSDKHRYFPADNKLHYASLSPETMVLSPTFDTTQARRATNSSQLVGPQNNLSVTNNSGCQHTDNLNRSNNMKMRSLIHHRTGISNSIMHAKSCDGSAPMSATIKRSSANGNDLAQGEGRKTGQTRQRTEKLTWHIDANGKFQGDEQSAVKRSPSTTHTVLAKHGLIVKENLGAGSYSKVKHALYKSSDNSKTSKMYPEQVAVKIIDQDKAPSDFQERFLPRELAVWPQLSHPNIVKMIDCFTEHRKVYMILEYVERGDTLKFIQRTGAVAESTGRVWVWQVVNAVKYLHDLNIAHRDLKLENMLIDKHNNIKICDFGFVKCCMDSDLSRTFCGSKSYAAPEILKGEPYPPKKADVWAIGVILFILVTGKMPFDETKGNKSLLEEQRKPNLDWPRGRRAVSEECKCLSAFCLRFQWPYRPDIQQVLAHPWLHRLGNSCV